MPAGGDPVTALLAKGLVLLALGVLAFLASRRKRRANVPDVVPVPATFDEAVAHVERWQEVRAAAVEESDWARDHAPSPQPARAVRVELPEAAAAGLLARVREPWERAGLQLVRARTGFKPSGLPERPAAIWLFDTTDPRRIARHVGPGADEGVSQAQIDAWLQAVREIQPFRLESLDGDHVQLTFAEPVRDATVLARLALDLHPGLQDPETLDPWSEAELARVIASEQSLTIAWT
jgi:hypothetical protein